MRRRRFCVQAVPAPGLCEPERCAARPGILGLEGSKPKRMHWLTYERSKERNNNKFKKPLAGALAKFGLLHGLIDS